MLKRIASLAVSATLCLGLVAGVANAVGSPTEHLEGEPDFRDARRHIALEQFREAIAALERLNLAKPREAAILNLIGFSHRKLKDYPASKRFYDAALEIDPYFRPALEYQGMWYIETGDLAGARANLAKLQQICATCEETQDLAKAIETGKTH